MGVSNSHSFSLDVYVTRRLTTQQYVLTIKSESLTSWLTHSLVCPDFFESKKNKPKKAKKLESNYFNSNDASKPK